MTTTPFPPTAVDAILDDIWAYEAYGTVVERHGDPELDNVELLELALPCEELAGALRRLPRGVLPTAIRVTADVLPESPEAAAQAAALATALQRDGIGTTRPGFPAGSDLLVPVLTAVTLAPIDNWDDPLTIDDAVRVVDAATRSAYELADAFEDRLTGAVTVHDLDAAAGAIQLLAEDADDRVQVLTDAGLELHPGMPPADAVVFATVRDWSESVAWVG